MSKTPTQSQEEQDNLQNSILEDLTLNEHFRLLRVVHGKVNFDPLYEGLGQFFANVIDHQNSYLPNSSAQVPFNQETFVFTWRLLTVNQVRTYSLFLRKLSFLNSFLTNL